MTSYETNIRHRRCRGRSRLLSYNSCASLAAVVLLTPSVLTSAKKVPSPSSPLSLSSIPTPHGWNSNFGFSGGGGAAVARDRRRRRKESSKDSEDADGVVSTAYLSRSEKTSVVAKGDKTGESSVQNNSRGDELNLTAIVCMSLLALQFGIQPILVRKYTPQTIVRSSVVLVQEVVKFGIAGAIYYSGTSEETRNKDLSGWSVKTWITLAGLPAFLYTIQNIASLMAYQNLEALTFNVLNQTKILSAALSCYFVMGKKQSRMQVVSLCLLILSTLVIESVVKPNSLVSLFSVLGGGAASGATVNLVDTAKNAFASLGSMGSVGSRRLTHGIVPVMVASLISGMAGALTQLNLQGGGSRKGSLSKRPPRNAYLFSMEMNVASVILLSASLFCSADGRNIIRSNSFFTGWTPHTIIPVITNSIGGILVGLVTKHAGSVRKGFALIFGLLLSGILQAGSAGLRSEQIVGGLLAALSLWMHTAHPYATAKTAKKKD